MPPSARRDPIIGQLLAGRYRVLRILGTGGMGAVFEAEHAVIQRRVAVKLLHPQLAAADDVVERFLNEARAAATLGHPNIIECLDAGLSDDGRPFLVLEFLDGRSLADELRAAGRLAPGRAVGIALQIASALSAAHAKGIIHRDLKPDNVYLSQRPGEPDHATVLDFGISRFRSPSGGRTQAGTVMGTPHYMAPEQMVDASATEAPADVYALGVTLYEMLTGQLPFVANSLMGMAMEIAKRPAPDVRELAPEVMAGLASAVARALERSPRDRFASMDAFAAELAPFADARSPSGAGLPPIRPGDLDGTLRPQPTPLKPDLIADDADTATSAPPFEAKPKPRWPWIAGGVVVALGIAAGVVESGNEPPPSTAPLSVAVPLRPPAPKAIAPTPPEAAPAPPPLKLLPRETSAYHARFVAAVKLETDGLNDAPDAQVRVAITQLRDLQREDPSDPALHRELSKLLRKLGVLHEAWVEDSALVREGNAMPSDLTDDRRRYGFTEDGGLVEPRRDKQPRARVNMEGP